MANAIILFKNLKAGTEVDLEVPLEITAGEFVAAINRAYNLGMDDSDPSRLYLQMEYPIGLLCGDESLESMGMRTGSIVYYKR